MKYTVVWVPEAEAEATRLWVDSHMRGSIAAATDAIDEMLKRNPFGVGESREGNRRILLVWPLAVSYIVSDDDLVVQVHEVWRYDM